MPDKPAFARDLIAQTLKGLPVLLVGAIGGLIFLQLRAPLAWMLGSMCIVAPLALWGWPRKLHAHVEPKLRSLMVVVLGVMLGSAFTPDMLQRGGEFFSLMGLMALYVPVSLGACYWVFRRGAGLDPTTSYFAAAPGGLQEMTLMGEAMGGNGRNIVLAHALRIFLVVMTIPFYFRLIEGAQVPSMPSGVHLNEMALDDALLLLGSGVVGFLAARRFRIPAAQLVGPMLVSAGVHLAGLSAAKPPPELVAMAQVVLGTALGCRFAGADPRALLRLAKFSGIATAVLLSLTLLFSYCAANLFGYSTQLLVLVLAPGGLAEMSLVALALGVEVAMVASMHVFRISIVVIIAPAVFRLLRLRPGRE